MADSSANWELLSFNPLTGRKVWAVRYIPTGVYGQPYEWSMVVVKHWWFNNRVRVNLVQGITVKKRRLIGDALIRRGFKAAEAYENGRKVYWNAAGVREVSNA